LTDEIEAAAGVEIHVKHAPEISAGQCASKDVLVASQAGAVFAAEMFISPTLAECRYTIKYATDLAAIARLYTAPYSCFCHELLHLRRYIVLRVPQVLDVMSAPGVPEFTITGLENGLEHLYIDRQLKDYGFDLPVEDGEPDFWSRSARGDARALHFRAPLLFEWLRTRYASSNIGIQKRADSFLEKCGMLGDAWRFHDAVRPLLDLTNPNPADAKLQLVRQFCLASNIPLY
jgi:hypothetical protein